MQAQEVVAYAHLARFKGDVLQAGGVLLREREILLDDSRAFIRSGDVNIGQAAYPDKAAVVDYALELRAGFEETRRRLPVLHLLGLSTDPSDCRLSFAAPIGVLLTCNHIVNQYLFIDDSAENLRKFEQTARNMHSLSRYSRSNQINREWIEEYLNEAHSKGLTSIRAHCNVMAWSDDREKLKRVKNDVGSQLALMEAKPRHNTVDLPTLFWAAIPGNAGDFPAEESFYTFIEQALCLFVEE